VEKCFVLNLGDSFGVQVRNIADRLLLPSIKTVLYTVFLVFGIVILGILIMISFPRIYLFPHGQ